MIARVWHGVTEANKADEYLDVLNRTGVPELEGTPGNQGVYVLRRIEHDEAHFLLISLWESREAIHAFAGDDIDVARYYLEDQEYLAEFEPNVTHYDVVVKPGS